MWVARGPFSLSAGTLRPRFLAGTASARLVGILFCAGLCAAGSRPAGGQGVFRAAADHVTLDVVVTDANNRPVSGLVKDDFTVLERGRRQAISELTFVSIPVENRVIDLEASPQVESDIASNAEESSRSRAIAIVIDDTILSPTDIVPTKRLLAALLGAVSNDDQVAISYVRRSDLGQSFTNQPAKLIRAVNHLKASVGLPGVAGGAMEARDFLTVLDNVAGVLRTAPQARRFIVLVSFRGCVPNPIPILSKTSPSVSAICKGVIDKAKQAGVPIYAVDPTGNLEDSVPGGFHDSLATLAVATGGRAFRFSQPTKSAAALMADNGSYYVIGYHSTLRRTDGRFQPVEVSVHKPGIIVRARSGYFAPSGQLAPTPRRAMAASLAHGVPSPALPLRVHLLPLRASAGGKTSVVVTMEVAYPLPESLGAGEFADEWRVGILASDPDDAEAEAAVREVRALDLSSSPETATSVRATVRAFDAARRSGTLALTPARAEGVPPAALVASGIASGLALAAIGALLAALLRPRGSSLARASEASPELHPAITYLVGCLRHELLKHRIGAASDALAALVRGEATPQQRAFLHGRLFGGEPLLAAWEGHLRAFERALGPRVDLRRRDRSFRDAARAIAAIQRLEGPLARDPGAAVPDLARAHAKLRAFDRELARLAARLVRTRVDEILLREVVSEVQSEYSAGMVALDEVRIHAPSEPVDVEVFRVDLVLVLKNLVRNAILAVGRDPAPRRLAVDVSVDVEATGEEMVRIHVRDTSPETITADAIRERRADRGLGLVSAALARYDAAISVEPGDGEFAKAVTLRFFRALGDADNDNESALASAEREAA